MGEGQIKFYPYKKGGGQKKVLAMLKQGRTKSCEVVSMLGS